MLSADRFLAGPILNSPYREPQRHWELDSSEHPTQEILKTRRATDFITPIPKPRRQGGAV
jgi:type III restriction enzyme